ncbi:hypothetical protein LZC95_38625 [Pendulispora brunnea]|uniref:Lipoprotein n=1 Tax=Pendulispora brunnea TaxID=2905690 RepID=A0ABZ2K2Q1_9BACT
MSKTICAPFMLLAMGVALLGCADAGPAQPDEDDSFVEDDSNVEAALMSEDEEAATSAEEDDNVSTEELPIDVSMPTEGEGADLAQAKRVPGKIYKDKKGWCHYRNWGGDFYCKSSYNHKLPNGYRNVFVIGTNHNVFTRWASPSGVSGWASLNGLCYHPGKQSITLKTSKKPWKFTIFCRAEDGSPWRLTRSEEGNWPKKWSPAWKR